MRRLAAILVILCLIVPAMSARAADPSNLLPVPSFKGNASGRLDPGSGWDWQGPDKLASVVADKPAVELNPSLELDFRNLNQSKIQWYCWSDLIPIDPNRVYLQSGWIKTDGFHKGFGASLARRFYDRDKKLIATPGVQNFTARNVSPTAWTWYSQKLIPQKETAKPYAADEIPANARYVRIGVFAAYYPRRAWFNDVRFEVYSPAADAPLAYGDNKIASAARLDPGAAITVDGKLDEPVWQGKDGWRGDFVRTVCPEAESVPAAAANQTRFKVALGKDNVYVAIVCHSADPSKPASPTTRHNDAALFTGETAEIFLDAGGNRTLAYHLGIGPTGGFYEQWLSRPVSLGTKVAVARSADGWQAEVSIPRDRLWQIYHEADGSVDQSLWNINVARQIPGAGADRYSSWSYTGAQGFANPANMGFLLLTDRREALLSRLTNRVEQLHRLAAQATPSDGAHAPDKLVEFKTAIAQLLASNDSLLSAVTKATSVTESAFAHGLAESRRAIPAMRQTLDQMQRLMVELPADRQSFGYVLYGTPLLERPRADRLPDKGELLNRLTMRLAANEQGQSTFSLFTKTALKDVSIEWSGLKDDAGHTIPDSAIDVRIVQPWGKQDQADILATDLRVKLAGWLKDYDHKPRFMPSIAADTSRKLWVGLDASAAPAPGTYHGAIRIKPANRPETELPVEVTILPFKLPDADRLVGFYYNGVLKRDKQPEPGGRAFMFYYGLTTPQSCLDELTAIRRAGFNFIVMADYAHGPLNPDYTRQLLTIAKKAGIDNVTLLGAEHLITPAVLKDAEHLAANRRALKERLTAIYKIADEVGIKNLYIYGFDEPNDEVGVRRNQIIAEVVHECGGRVVSAIIFGDTYRKLEHVIDVSIMNWASMTADGDQVQQYAAAEKAGRSVLYYANLTADHPALVRLCFGWYLEKSGLGGNVPWAYYYLGLSWKPFGGESVGTAYYAFPTADRPIPTLKFEAAAAGVTDLRYIQLLKTRMQSSGDQALIAEARAALEKILGYVSLVNEKGVHSRNYQLSPRLPEAWRSDVQDLLVKFAGSHHEK